MQRYGSWSRHNDRDIYFFKCIVGNGEGGLFVNIYNVYVSFSFAVREKG